MMAYNGADFDGDILFTTSNQIIINGISDEPAIVCEGKSSDKKGNVNKDDFIKCIKNSFGNKVGSVTNVGSSFYDKISLFEKGTKEYDELNYRIQTIQYIQQECIDSAKNGIPPRPIPLTWTDNRAVAEIEDKEKRELYEKIVTERKPYYFIYIYESLLKEHNKYNKATETNCYRRFGMYIDNMKTMAEEMLDRNDLSENEKQILFEMEEFLYWYEKKQIVSNNPCIVNKMAKIVEDEFDTRDYMYKDSFDYEVYKSKDIKQIGTKQQIEEIKELYKAYKNSSKSYITSGIGNDLEFRENEASEREEVLRDSFHSIISDKQILLNTMLDLSYKKTIISKSLTWTICGDIILENMLVNSNNKIQYPIKSYEPEFSYNGIGYKMKEIEVGGIK